MSEGFVVDDEGPRLALGRISELSAEHGHNMGRFSSQREGPVRLRCVPIVGPSQDSLTATPTDLRIEPCYGLSPFLFSGVTSPGSGSPGGARSGRQ